MNGFQNVAIGLASVNYHDRGISIGKSVANKQFDIPDLTSDHIKVRELTLVGVENVGEIGTRNKEIAGFSSIVCAICTSDEDWSEECRAIRSGEPSKVERRPGFSWKHEGETHSMCLECMFQTCFDFQARSRLQ
jgi:hypothetical protein